MAIARFISQRLNGLEGAGKAALSLAHRAGRRRMDDERWRAGALAVLRGLRALAIGSVAGVVLALGIMLGPGVIQSWISGTGSSHVISTTGLFEVGTLIASYYAAGICLVASPIWWGLRRLGRGGWIDAAILGLVLTSAAWFLTNLDSLSRDSVLASASALGAAGAVAGVVTWRADPARKRAGGPTNGV